MTIAQAFNEIAVAQGGTANNSGTIAGAIDALNDALAGSDQEAASTIEEAVRLLGSHIGGGASVTVEALTATENKTYTAPEGKAYSPVTVNVSGGGSTEYDIKCYTFILDDDELTEVQSFIYPVEVHTSDGFSTWQIDKSNGALTKASAGQMLAWDTSDATIEDGYVMAYTDSSYITDVNTSQLYLPNSTIQTTEYFTMPAHDAAFIETDL